MRHVVESWMQSKPIMIRPIGYVHTSYSDIEVSQSWPRGVSGYIEILPEYLDGLRGLEDFSHVIILAWLHKVTEENRHVLKVRYRRLTRAGINLEELPEVGVFTSDSPHRPNPLAVTIARVREVKGNIIQVDGLDLYDGTPVLDLRAYTPSYSIKDFTIPPWYQRLLEKVDRWRGQRSSSP